MLNLLILTVALRLGGNSPEAPDARSILPAATQAAFEPFHKAFVSSGDGIWEFSANPMPEGGVRVRIIDCESEAIFTLASGRMGEVLGLVATKKREMIALGVASLSEARDRIEYRMFFTWGPGRSDTKWSWSDSLITRPLVDPFTMMSIAIPEGDSTILTFSSLTRGMDGDAVETHFLINHCPPDAGGYTTRFTKTTKQETVINVMPAK